MARLAKAGVDGQAVRAWVCENVDSALSGATRSQASWADLEAGADAAFGRYLTVRESGPSQLTVRVAEAIRRINAEITIACLDFGPLYPLGPNGRRWQNGVDLDIILPAVDEVHPTFYFTDPVVLADRVGIYNDVIAGEALQVPAIRAILPQTDGPSGLAEQLANTAGTASGFTFYNYSFMGLETLDWIRSAVEKHPPGYLGVAS